MTNYNYIGAINSILLVRTMYTYVLVYRSTYVYYTAYIPLWIERLAYTHTGGEAQH